MTGKFTIIAITQDISFSMKLFKICEKYGYDLVFPEVGDLNYEQMPKDKGILVFDASESTIEYLEVLKLLSIEIKIPMIAIMPKILRSFRDRLREINFQLTYPKSMFLKNISQIIEQINE